MGAAKLPKPTQKSLERALEDAVSRALRDNLTPLQRTADELHHAFSDLIAACSSTRPSNALPALLRAQTAAAALAAGLSVLSNFVAVALNPREHARVAEESEETAAPATEESGVAQEQLEAAMRDHIETESEWPEESSRAVPPMEEIVTVPGASAEEVAVAEAPAFELKKLSLELQNLHRRANRVAKVAMQDIKLLRPKEVRLGLEHKDICSRLRNDLDKARKEYDRRFRTILDHPVDYFHHWMVEILAEGNSEALGEYPYPSPVLRN